MAIEFTGEMFLPWTEVDNTYYEHVHRYFLTRQLVENKKVLDLACGEGYGTKLLAETAKSVIGVDINKKIIEHARNKYQSKNLQFLEGSITKVPISQKKNFDVITCFEAIEHIIEQEKMLKEVTRLLRDDGLFLISTPNKQEYSYSRNQTNPFHQKELNLEQFRELLESFFPFVKLYGQKTYTSSNIWPLFNSKNTYYEVILQRIDDKYLETNIANKKPEFFLALASKKELKNLEIIPSFTVDVSGTITYLKRVEKELENKSKELSKAKSYVSQLEKDLEDKSTELSKAKSHVSNLEEELELNYERLQKLEETKPKYYSSRL